MKKLFLVLITLIIVGIYSPAVLAESVIDYNQSETFSVINDETISPLLTTNGYWQASQTGTLRVVINDAETYKNTEIKSIEINTKSGYLFTNTTLSAKQSYTWDDLPLKVNDDVVGYGTLGFYKYGPDMEYAHVYLWVHELDITPYTGKIYLYMDATGYEFNNLQAKQCRIKTSPVGADGIWFSTTSEPDNLAFWPTNEHASYSILWNLWYNEYRSYNHDANRVTIEFIKEINGNAYTSHILLYDAEGSVLINSQGNTNIEITALPIIRFPVNFTVTDLVSDTQFYREIGVVHAEPHEPNPLNIYIRNSQTGALIADAHILISANVNDEFHDVINQTLPSGIYTGSLQPTGGGFPNPDFYRLITTADGYISVMPHIDFEVDRVTTIYVYLEPTGGAPEDENNTFIDFYVRDLNANPISGATVNFGGKTLITNSAGYAVLEVAKNATYSWTVSKSGYGPLTGNAVIGADPRHTINTVLAPAVTPTTSTPIPTSTSISPTPTMTAPNGEPVSNWLEWFAAHFGMILGGGVEIGKIFMWLCFTVPVGVYVGKESKAGAAGFMAGAGIVTLFFVLIGWVPIWLVVLLALIIGLLYAKVFSNSDNGGGR